MEVIQQGEINIIQIVNSICTSNAYIISASFHKNLWLIDCGDIEQIVDYIQSEQKILRGVFLTHTHFDHIYGLNKLKEIYPNFKVFTSKEGRISLHSDKLNLSKYHNQSFIYQYDDINLLNDKDIIELYPNRYLYINLTIGHDWSCISYKIEHALFTGDSYIPGLKVVTSFPKSNKKDAEKSLELIKSMCYPKMTQILSGHGFAQIFI